MQPPPHHPAVCAHTAPMTPDAPATEPPATIPAALRALWREARGWVSFIVSTFDRAALRTTGIRRESGARLSIWLLDIESAVRRLILAAALALTGPISRRIARRERPSQPATASRPASFSIFRIHGSGAQTRRTLGQRPPTPYGHIRFPADPILALGARPARIPHAQHNGGPPIQHTRPRNPLDRWVRLSRHDPDWRPPEPRSAPPASAAPRQSRPRQRTPRAPYIPQALPESAWDWRRHHDEWLKLVPAPVLAARLDALERITANPALAILRTARRLQSERERTLALARAARPVSRQPRRARHIQAGGHAPRLALACHDRLASPDTS